MTVLHQTAPRREPVPPWCTQAVRELQAAGWFAVAGWQVDDQTGARRPCVVVQGTIPNPHKPEAVRVLTWVQAMDCAAWCTAHRMQARTYWRLNLSDAAVIILGFTPSPSGLILPRSIV